MTEFSYPWGCTATGDGGATSYSLAIVEDTNKFLSNLEPTTNGVIYWTESPLSGLLAPTNPSGSTVRIAAGVGIVEGWIYTNDANVDFDINAAPGNANATDMIVLRRSLAGQTVRLARIGGAASSTAVLTQTVATWEIPICEIDLDGSGNFTFLRDTRILAYGPTSTMVKIAETVLASDTADITFSSIPSVFRHLLIEGVARTDRAASDFDGLNIQFNGDTAANYDSTKAQIANNTWTSTNTAAGTSLAMVSVAAATARGNFFSPVKIDIPRYYHERSVDDSFRAAMGKSYVDGQSAAQLYMYKGAGSWRNANPITSIRLFPEVGTNLLQYTLFSLYGII